MNSIKTSGAIRRAIAKRRPRAPPGPSLEKWDEDEALRVRACLQDEIYGLIPELAPFTLAEERPVPDLLRGEEIVVERWRAQLANAGEALLQLKLLVVLPARVPVRTVLLAQTSHRGPSPIDDADERDKHMWRRLPEMLREWVLGRHIHTPPFAKIAARGVGLVLFRPAELIADHPILSRPVIERLSIGTPIDVRGGMLAHWAAALTAVRKLVSADVRFADIPIVAWGHSRHGKAALLAAAFDPQFAGVIAHQSGRYGASLTQGFAGESPAHIARTYPHWFCRRFHAGTLRRSELEIDQHHLLALIAPRPMLLGNGRHDLWADPGGALKAARAASAAYVALGAAGFMESNAAQAALEGGVAFFVREGGHGVNAEDWAHFLSFLEHKFGARTARAFDAGVSAPTGLADELPAPLASGSQA